jgi:hypothetical protein
MTRNTGLQGEEPGLRWGPEPAGNAAEAARGRGAYAGRSVVLVGLMGAGKTSIGRRLALRLGMPFRDAGGFLQPVR